MALEKGSWIVKLKYGSDTFNRESGLQLLGTQMSYQIDSSFEFNSYAVNKFGLYYRDSQCMNPGAGGSYTFRDNSICTGLQIAEALKLTGLIPLKTLPKTIQVSSDVAAIRTAQSCLMFMPTFKPEMDGYNFPVQFSFKDGESQLTIDKLDTGSTEPDQCSTLTLWMTV